MNKLKYILIVAITFGAFSCSEDFLEHKNLYSVLDDNYYQNADQIAEAIVGVYSVLPVGPGVNHPTLVGNILSPYFLGGADGASAGDVGALNTDGFTSSGLEDVYVNLWQEYYRGIFRANVIIKRFEQAEYEDVDLKNTHWGEVHFLRAYLYFRLCQFYGTVPLITDPEPTNNPRASEVELFSQIASDLKIACETMPSVKVSSISDEQVGHATRWSARALMARVYLFYSGTYANGGDLPLVEGGSVTKADALAYIEDVIANSGHRLLDNFESLWPYSASELKFGAFPYSNDAEWAWVGEGANPETVFAIKYNQEGDHPNDEAGNARLARSNQMVLYNGLREASTSVPYASGWGFAPAHPALWDAYDDANDARKMGTLVNWYDASADTEGNIKTDWNPETASGYHNTGCFNKKYIPLRDTANTNLWNVLGYATADDSQMANMQDEYIIRFADVLLMAAELGSSNAQAYFDMVRTRSGAATKTVSEEAIKLERLLELAGEGIYYWDLMRWGDLETAFGPNGIGEIDLFNQGSPAKYSVNYNEERRFLPIPESQISLSDGVLIQHPGWN